VYQVYRCVDVSRFRRRPRLVRVSNDGRFRTRARFRAVCTTTARAASQDHVRVGARGAQLLLGLSRMADLGTGTVSFRPFIVLFFILFFDSAHCRRLSADAGAARRHCV
jgi:hypothetical protein